MRPITPWEATVALMTGSYKGGVESFQKATLLPLSLLFCHQPDKFNHECIARTNQKPHGVGTFITTIEIFTDWFRLLRENF
jgi:hypothetical protein